MEDPSDFDLRLTDHLNANPIVISVKIDGNETVV
jgi:hypothetical protein